MPIKVIADIVLIFLFRQMDLAIVYTDVLSREKSLKLFGGTCTMMRSLWSGVSGLKTHQMEMDVIGNNIANVNTTAYKSQATGFQDVLYQTVKEGSGAGQNTGTTNAAQVGLGARVGSIYTNISAQGSAITTNNVFDIMITGPSFFVISPDSVTNNFSRDGSFTIDSTGHLVTQANGYYVMGVMGEGGVSDGAAVSKLQVINTVNGKINDTIAGTATSEGYFKGNIDSYDSQLGEGRALMMEVFGSDGQTYTLKFNVTDAGDDKDNTFNLELGSVLDSDGNIVNVGNIDPVKLEYDKHNGRLLGAQSVRYTFSGAPIGPINIDLSNTNNYAGSSSSHTSTIYAYKGDLQGLNKGYANGELTGISFGVDGSVYGTYSNGQTIKKAQIAVAEFSNAMGLEKVGDNLYAASLNSGEPMIQDITKDGGYMNSGVLEGSNVDLAKEFTDMITTQRGFQANSKVITTSDEMLQLLKQLKR